MTSPTPLKVPPAWDSIAIRAKAQRYAEQMLAYDRNDWRFAFWSSLVLELLARAALGHVSPVLLADPEDWNNIYYALGHAPTVSKFSAKSLTTNKVFSRLRQILPSFGKELEEFCILHTGRRNAELHSAETPFDVITDSEWLPSFYRSCEILLASVGSNLEMLFGPREAATAAKLIGAAADDAAKAVAGDIAAHRKVWEMKDAKQRAKLAAQSEIWAARRSGHVVDCPACKSKALVNGDPIKPPTKTIEGDLITETQEFLPTKFECIACGLKISGLSQLNACGLGDSFKRTATYDAASFYAPDADDDGSQHEEDNNEPF